MILRVTRYGEPILHKKGKKITEFNQDLQNLANDMIETMHDSEGIGLAAQQIDKALQLFVMDLDSSFSEFNYKYDDRTPPLDLIMPMIVCNPVIKPASKERDSRYEGCLSFPGVELDEIERSSSIKMKFQDVDGAEHTLECNGLLARCCQHEYDHLQGVLFNERAGKASLKREDSKIKEIKRLSEEFLKSSK